MYKKIYVPVDNSPLSEACSVAALSLASAFGAEIVGSHVYAARMHERRFRQMEATLPEEYLEERELERQRAIHDSLITLGLQLISDSYLDALEHRCLKAEVPFSRKTFEGKNWERLVEDINSSDYDLVVMGARGHGTARPDGVGSVSQRVLRRTHTDTLIVKEPEAFRDGAGRSIVVALDGSQEAFGALQVALALGKAFDRPVEAIAAYDPYFHYAVFHSMVEVLSTEAARVFRFKEQEQLHEEIIDNGLARLYQTHLAVAERIAEAAGIRLTTTLLAGRAADEIAGYAEMTQPWLLLLGRIGVHSREEMDIGSVTEHLLRSAPCNLLVASRRFSPPLEVWGRSSVQWSPEAEQALRRAPEEYRGTLRLLVHRLALEQGRTVVTASLLSDALAIMRPPPENAQRMNETAVSVAVEVLRREGSTVYICPRCAHAVRRSRPVACPVCQTDGGSFLTVDAEALEAAARAQGGVQEASAFDGKPIRWSRVALAALRRIEDAYQRNRARLLVEKAARLALAPVITLEFASAHLPERRPARGSDAVPAPTRPASEDRK